MKTIFLNFFIKFDIVQRFPYRNLLLTPGSIPNLPDSALTTLCGASIITLITLMLPSLGFSTIIKSVKQLPEAEKTWVLLPNDYRDVKNANGETLYRIKECVDDFEYRIKDDSAGRYRAFKLREKRIVTYNPKLAKKQIYEINKEIEKAKLLKASQAKKSEYGDCSKYVIFTPADKKGKETDGKIKVTMNEELIKKSIELAGYNMLVTSEITMSDKEIYDVYHNLWRIEESFRIMKSQLDARPVYLQKEDTITGHFLICYLAVLLTRLLQFNELHNNYCSEDLFDFVRDFRVVKISDRKYINSLGLAPYFTL